jgi:hypothetical protein
LEVDFARPLDMPDSPIEDKKINFDNENEININNKKDDKDKKDDKKDDKEEGFKAFTGIGKRIDGKKINIEKIDYEEIKE